MSIDARRQLRRLRFVSARYEALQGLRQVQTGVLWLLLALWAGVLFSPGGMRPSSGLVAALATILLVGAMVGSLLLDRRIKRWYERTYGRVEPDPAARRIERIGQAGLVTVVIVIVSLGLLDGLADWGVLGGCALVALAVAALTAWRYGGVRMVDLALAASYALLTILAAAGAWSHRYAFAIICATNGVAFVVAGLLDHLLLARALRVPETEDDGARAV
jgi:hypothetical protein